MASIIENREYRDPYGGVFYQSSCDGHIVFHLYGYLFPHKCLEERVEQSLWVDTWRNLTVCVVTQEVYIIKQSRTEYRES